MDLKFAQQINTEILQNLKIDLFIASSGFESRSTSLAKKLQLIDPKKVVIGFKEKKMESKRKLNDIEFESLGFIPNEFEASEGSSDDIINILDKIIIHNEYQSKLNILVDYSCMTKVWYATIINYFRNKTIFALEVNLIFSYTPAKYSKPQDPLPNQYIGPIPGIFRISSTNKPTALIMGLGYEKYRAKGLSEYIDPEIAYAFYPDPSFDKKYVMDIKHNNDDLLDSLGESNIFKFPINDLKATESALTSLYFSLRDKYKIILAPLGPKPFALLSLLLSSKYADVDVWRVSSGEVMNTNDRIALDQQIVCQVNFVRNYFEFETKIETAHNLKSFAAG